MRQWALVPMQFIAYPIFQDNFPHVPTNLAALNQLQNHWNVFLPEKKGYRIYTSRKKKRKKKQFVNNGQNWAIFDSQCPPPKKTGQVVKFFQEFNWPKEITYEL